MNRQSLTHPGVDPTCKLCSGTAIQVGRNDAYAAATLCRCCSICPHCKDTGWVRSVQGDRSSPLNRCTCQLFLKRLELFGLAQVPARLGHCTFLSFRLADRSTPGQRDAFTTAMTIASQFRPGDVNRGLVLHGDVGRGKTHLLVSMIYELTIRHGVRTRFVEFSHLLARLKGRFDRGEGAASILDKLVNVEVLAIDELGKGMMTQWELTVIDELISRRYNAARTVLATSNYEPGAARGQDRPNLATAHDRRKIVSPTLADRVGDRVHSRLEEMCEFRHMGGSDHRLNAKWKRR
ncbi:MAG: DNA replication protein DnaC [Kiritimatiellia bacterium]|jgi:DNA replication protein DnaC